MKKKNYFISGIIILLLMAGVLIFSQNLINFKNPNLEFTYGPCDNTVNSYEQTNLGIKETTWLDKNILQVKVFVGINCKEKIISGNYKILENRDNQIILEYKASRCAGFYPCATCMCAHELVYKINNLEERDYQFNIERLY